jgi:hypothetical protein
MSAIYKHYLARNEQTMSVDTLTPTIVLDHTSSLVRKFDFGSDWNVLHIRCRVALSGSIATGNLTNAAAFFGVCAGVDGRYRSSSFGGTGSHCFGYSGNTTFALTTCTAVTDAKTDPASIATHFYFPARAISVITGSLRYAGQTGQLGFPRYETAFSSSAGANYIYLGNVFQPMTIVIKKSNSGWILDQASFNVSTAADRITCSMHIPFNAYKMHDMTGLTNNSLNYYFQTQPINNLIRFGAPNAIITWNDITFLSANSPNEAAFGGLDSLNIFWRCDSQPNTKLLIKDIMVYRYG